MNERAFFPWDSEPEDVRMVMFKSHTLSLQFFRRVHVIAYGHPRHVWLVGEVRMNWEAMIQKFWPLVEVKLPDYDEVVSRYGEVGHGGHGC